MEGLDPQGQPYSLTVSLWVEPTISKNKPMIVEFQLKNNGSNGLAVLPWGSPLETSLSQDIFSLVHEGVAIGYSGPVVKRREPIPSDYLSIRPGATLKARLDVSDSYPIFDNGLYQLSLKLGSLAMMRDGTIFHVNVQPTLPIEIEVI